MSKTITSAVLSVVTSYDAGSGNTGDKRPFAIASLNDFRLYDFTKLGAIPLQNAYQKFDLTGRTGEPVFWPTNTSYSTATYTLPLIPLPDQAKVAPGSSVYTPNSTDTEVAYDDSSLEALLQTLCVSFLAYSSQNITSGTDGLSTATLKIYAAYIDVTYDDESTSRYWASGVTELPGGKWANGNALAPAPGSPTGTTDAENATDEDDTTYASLKETNKLVGFLSFSALWNPAKLTLDWRLHILCNDPPEGHIGEAYTHTFTIKGGTPPYSVSVTDGELPPGLDLSTDGTVSGTPTTEGTYSFTLTATEAGTTDVIVADAQSGSGASSMDTLVVGGSAQAAASHPAIYMGTNSMGSPYWSIAVAVAPPSPAVAGVDGYMVTVQNCNVSGTAGGDNSEERDFFQVASGQPVTADTLLGKYQSDPASTYTYVKFQLYLLLDDGTRSLATGCWPGGANSQIVSYGAAPTGSGATMSGVTPGHASASGATFMGTNSSGAEYWSIAVAVDPADPPPANGYVVTVQNTNSSGTPGGDDGGVEKEFFVVPADTVGVTADNLLGVYQTSPSSTFTYVKFRLYSVDASSNRTLLTGVWPSGADYQLVNYAKGGGAVAPADIPPVMTASVTCSITIVGGALAIACGSPGTVIIGTPFSFRPTVTMGTVTLDSSYDLDGTISWVVTGLPPGLVFDTTVGSATYGHIAGSATTPGTYSYTATVTSSTDGSTATATCSLDVQGAGFDAACGTPPTAAQWIPYDFAPPFADGITGWTVTGLPPGLAWIDATGHITGTPSELGAFVYTAVNGDTSFTCSITVAAQGDSGLANCGSPGIALLGLPFSFTPPFTSQASITSWTFTGLPPGLGWDTDSTSSTYGMITGIPSGPGGYAYHATATDSGGHVLHFTCTLVVKTPGDSGDGANDTGGHGYCWWLDLWVWQPVTAFTTLNIEVQMPPAYSKALRYTLARELASTYGRDPSIVSAIAEEAVAAIDNLNISTAAGTEDPPVAPPQAA